MSPPAPVNLGQNYLFGGVGSLGQFLTSLGPVAFTIAGLMLTFYLLIGAFKLMTSAGDKAAVASGREMIVHAIIGFIMLMLLFVLFEFLPQYFGIQWRLL